MLSRSGHPIGEDGERFIRLYGVIRPQVDPEFVLALHAFMHHEAERNRRLAARLDSRRTDDGAGRSTPLYKLNLWFSQNLERLIAHVAHPENGFDGSV